MNDPTRKPGPAQQWGMLLAILVVLVCICVVGWQLMLINQQQQRESTDALGSLLTYEIAKSAQQKIKSAIKTDDLKYKLISQSGEKPVYGFSLAWSPMIDLYAVSSMPHPPTLELTDLSLPPTILKWAQANPDQVKQFVNVENPLGKFKIVRRVAAADVPLTLTGTVGVDNSTSPVTYHVLINDDQALLGQPLFTLGASAILEGSAEHKSLIVATGRLRQELARGLLSAYELHVIRSETGPAGSRGSSGSSTDPNDKTRASTGPNGRPNGAGSLDSQNGQSAGQGAEQTAERNRMAEVLAQKKAAMEKARQEYLQPLFKATERGTVWIGQWSAGADVGPIAIRFIHQNEAGELAGYLFDPADPQTNKAFTGRITLDPVNADGWPIRLSMVPESGFTAVGPEDYKGARGWLQKNDSYLIFIRLDPDQSMAGRTSRRAALLLNLPGHTPKPKPRPEPKPIPEQIEKTQPQSETEPSIGPSIETPGVPPAEQTPIEKNQKAEPIEPNKQKPKRPLITEMRPETEPDPAATPPSETTASPALESDLGNPTRVEQQAPTLSTAQIENQEQTPESKPQKPLITQMRPETEPEQAAEPVKEPVSISSNASAPTSALTSAADPQMKPDSITASNPKQSSEPISVVQQQQPPIVSVKKPEPETVDMPVPEIREPEPAAKVDLQPLPDFQPATSLEPIPQ